ncbi:hypothetical protein [Planctomicrobium sp. SH664]|uniref:hypothetical protein n=1 Tax=Planctomicrobium sp. SH664 TaxID=3448125 RepID=UPI003F5B3CCF
MLSKSPLPLTHVGRTHPRQWLLAPGETQAPRRGGEPAQSRRLSAAGPHGSAKQIGPTAQG